MGSSDHSVGGQPIPLLLFCPDCGEQHIDAPNPALGWDNPPHRTHQCQHCGYLWRPCDWPTTGVATIATQGQGDRTPVPNMVRALSRALRRRDQLWIRALCVALPLRVVPMVLAVLNRMRPELQGANEAHVNMAATQQQDDLRQAAVDLAKEPTYTLPQSPGDLVE